MRACLNPLLAAIMSTFFVLGKQRLQQDIHHYASSVHCAGTCLAYSSRLVPLLET